MINIGTSRNRNKANKGQALVELSVIVMVMLILFYVTIEMTLLIIDRYNLLTISHVTAKNICLECGWLSDANYGAERTACVARTVDDMMKAAHTIFPNFSASTGGICGGLFLYVDPRDPNNYLSDPKTYRMILKKGTITPKIDFIDGVTFGIITYNGNHLYNIEDYALLATAEIKFRRPYYTPLSVFWNLGSGDQYATTIY